MFRWPSRPRLPRRQAAGAASTVVLAAATAWPAAVMARPAAAMAHSQIWLAPDFVVDLGPEACGRRGAPRPGAVAARRAALRRGVPAWQGTPATCAEHLAQTICVARDPQLLPAPGLSRDCDLAAAAALAPAVRAAVAALPQGLAAAACAVVQLVVEPALGPTAWAGVASDGLYLGVRRAVLDAEAPGALSAVLASKARAPFANLPAASPPGVRVVGVPDGPRALLSYLLAHELAHLRDFVDDASSRCPPWRRCATRPGSFAALSWEDSDRPWPMADFPARAGLCFFGCAPQLGPDAVPAVYAELAASPFVTLYASHSPMEDLAETVAAWWLAGVGGSALVDAGAAGELDTAARLARPPLSPKRDWIAAWLGAPPG